MNWNELYCIDKTPCMENIEQYIGEGAFLFKELCLYIESAYGIKPKMSYSKCSAQPGWNLKYQKGGRSLCTIYPMPGFFIALVVAGAREEMEIEQELETLDPYVAKLYINTPFSCGGRWLMIHVKSAAVLEDIQKIIGIRVKPGTKTKHAIHKS